MKNQLIAICSGTKGIGKTWLCANICHILGLYKQKVLFFDADCGVENIAYQLDLDFKNSYQNLLNGTLTANNMIYKYDKGSFDIIGSTLRENILASAPVGRIQVLTQDLFYVSKFYDYTIIDCSDDDIKNINSFFNLCKTAILIVNSDPKSSETAYKKIEKLKKINLNIEIKIVINRAISYNEGNQVYAGLAKAAKIYLDTNLSLLGIIRKDARIRDCVLNKSLLINRYPASEGAEDVVKIAKKLLEGL